MAGETYKLKIHKRNRKSLGSHCVDIVIGLALILVALICFYPMYHVFIISISSSKYISQDMVKLLPMGVNLDVYKIIFKSEKIWNAYKNTMIYTVSGTAINLIMTSLCAYPLSRKEFYGRKFFTVFDSIIFGS